MKEFAVDYETLKDLERKMDESKSDSEKESVRSDYRNFCDSIEAKGHAYSALFRRYDVSRDNGNDLIDFDDPSQYDDPESLVENLRKFGVEKFTFSSDWSGATEAVWKLVEAGAKLNGMVEINDRSKRWEKNPEKKHAFLFSL